MRANSLIFAQLGLVVSLLGSTASYATERPIPPDAKPGALSTSTSKNRQFLIDGDLRQLSTGTQIRNQKNVLVQPQHLVAQLIGADVPILYTENNHGHIQRIWILTTNEIQQYTPNTPSLLELIFPDRTAQPSRATSDRMVKLSDE